jgi:hypothetical protein
MARPPSDSSLPEPLRCPSGRCEEGAVLLGVVDSTSTVRFVRPLTIVTKGFVERAQQGRKPEQRFRFSHECRESDCRWWAEARCSLIEDLASQPDEGRDEEHLPPCVIRSTCRWFHQRGREACRICPTVVTQGSPAPARG